MISYNSITAFYVSNCEGAADSNTGLSPVAMADGNGPLKTISQALSRVAGLRRIGVLQPISIRLAGGEYALTDTLRFDETAGDVTVEPVGNDYVSIIGGKRINGFTTGEFNGHKCLCAYIQEVKEGKWAFTDFYVNGKRANFTRYPEEGYLYPEDVENHEGKLFTGSKWFIAKKGDIKNFRNVEDCIISFCHYWVDEHTPIESYDPITEKVTMHYKSRFNIDGGKNTSSGLEYYMENVAEEFRKPNEWYLDRPSGMLYYIPESDDVSPENIRAYAPCINKLISIKKSHESVKKVCGIRFRGLHFSCTRGDYASGGGVQGEQEIVAFASDGQAVANADGSISFEGAHACSLENCSLENFGVHGVVIGTGCDSIRITGCTFFDGGAGAVKVAGSAAGGNAADYTFGNVITDNIIKRCGRRYLAACGILLTHSYSNTVSHNDISDLFYTGISCGWVWGYTDSVSRDNIIEKNHIYDLGQGVLSDMGGIYLLGMQPGTIVSGNLIHDIKSRHYGGWALYTDEGSSFMTLENNICYNTSNNSYHQHYGSMNTVRNNIFAFSDGEMIRVSRPEMHLSIIFERNIIYSNGSVIYGLDKRHTAQNTVGSSYNLIYDRVNSVPVMYKLNGENKALGDIQACGMEYGSVVADPLFKDPVNYDFTLDKNSPAYKIGFKDIDMSDVGVRLR